MGYLSILGKGLTSIFFFFFLSKIMGRKQVSQLNLFDYIIGISIGSIAAEMTLNNEINFFEGVFALVIYALVAYLITELTSKSIIARRLITGSPCILIEKGKILYTSLKKSKLDLGDLLQEARINGYFDLSQIEYAIMESNGKISFLVKSKYQQPQRKDLKLKTPYEGLCCNAVLDGKIMENNLRQIKKDVKWFKTRLAKEYDKGIENLLLVTIDSQEHLKIYEKNEEKEAYKVFE